MKQSWCSRVVIEEEVDKERDNGWMYVYREWWLITVVKLF